MKKRGSIAVILLIIIILIVIVGLIWYFNEYSHDKASIQTNTNSSSSTSGQLVLSCDTNYQNPLLPYINQVMGIAFCYPGNLSIATDSNNINPGTQDITWPNTYTDSFSKNTFKPYLSFRIVESNSSSIISSLPQCDLSGSKGDYNCILPDNSQITYGRNGNGLSSALFRADFVLNDVSNIINTSTGPYAYVELGAGRYLIFQSAVAVSLPSYVDNDLKEILNTVQIKSK